MSDKKKITETDRQRAKRLGLNKCCVLIMLHGDESVQYNEIIRQIDKIGTEFADVLISDLN